MKIIVSKTVDWGEKKRQGWKCVYIDLEETTTEEGFLRLVLEVFKVNGVWIRRTHS